MVFFLELIFQERFSGNKTSVVWIQPIGVVLKKTKFDLFFSKLIFWNIILHGRQFPIVLFTQSANLDDCDAITFHLENGSHA